MSHPVQTISSRLGTIARRDPVLVVSALLALGSCVLVPPDELYRDYVDLRTLGLLFSLMTTMAGLSHAGVFQAAGEALLSRTSSGTGAIMKLVLLPFFASMLVTNDVSLIAFVPFALIVLRMIGRESATVSTVILMTVAANLGSMVTPIGNPQNLYLFTASGMDVVGFMALTLPYALLAGALLVACVLANGRRRHGFPARGASSEHLEGTRVEWRAVAPWVVLFALSLLAVVRVLPVRALVVVAAGIALAFDRPALREVDYALLLTFVMFFVFVGNVGRLAIVSDLLSEVVRGNELLVSVAASQVVSNVPAALLLSGFTSAWPALIVGTNVGGLGTLIASMASLISYKQVVSNGYASAGTYLVRFTLANLVFLVPLLALALLLA